MSNNPRFICLDVQELEIEEGIQILAFKVKFLIRGSGICFYAELVLDENGKDCDFPDNLEFYGEEKDACMIACFMAFEDKIGGYEFMDKFNEDKKFTGLIKKIKEFKKGTIFQGPWVPWWPFSIEELEYVLEDMKKQNRNK